MSCHLPLGPEKRLLSILFVSMDIILLKMQAITWKAVTDLECVQRRVRMLVKDLEHKKEAQGRPYHSLQLPEKRV